jgi:hypothetical protein
MAEEVEIQETPEPVKPETDFVVLAPGTIASDFALRSLNKALGCAQNEFEDAVKSAVNTYGGWKYTPLKSIVDAVRPSLTKYHLTILQFPVTDLEEKTITIYTRLAHWDSGEWMQNALELPGELALGKDGASKFNQQTIGGSQTYAQKYAYKAIAGIPDGEEMIDSTDEKGDLPARKNTQTAQQKARSMQQASVISHQPAGASAAAGGAQPATQRAAASSEAVQAQAGQLKFIPPNGLTTVIKSVQSVEGKPAAADRKAIQPYVVVTFTGMHNGLNFASCFDTRFWPLLRESVGLECHFQIAEKDNNGKHFINITDVIYVDGQEYVNGVPVMTGE